ncbi:PREDICTED: uncharacterized protein CG4449 [Papilio polytes]|uniref:uncharacterized protein CG4449 n=1 Tax=Papilio polytes TaxID=76194 RepID=UPI00067688A3|nr:PREDICTED: uncharacterized protein CG4449 [Papilio polytes]
MMISSSDSEEDCYSNAALKLEKLKNAYIDEKLDNSSLLNESSDVEVVTEEKNNKNPKAKGKGKNVTINDEEQDDLELEKILSYSTRRQTRSSTRNKYSESIIEILDTSLNKSVTTRRRKQSLKNSTVVPPNRTTTNRGASTRGTPNRGRTRGRGRGRSQRGCNTNTNCNTSIPDSTPVFSVGNTLEYEDTLEGQKLFSKANNSNNVIIIDDSDVLDENEELSVKVYWRSSDYYPFKIRKFQKLTPIFKYFAEKENVSENNLLFMYNDKILKASDTPDSINYSIAKFIDGGVVNRDVTKLVNDKTTDNFKGIQIKFQCQNTKKPLEVSVQPSDKLSLAMIKCAEHLEMPLNKLKFVFDGDSVTGTMTPEELDLEGGECIDVKIIS